MGMSLMNAKQFGKGKGTGKDKGKGKGKDAEKGKSPMPPWLDKAKKKPAKK